jgi:predicted ATP-dependent serine protease
MEKHRTTPKFEETVFLAEDFVTLDLPEKKRFLNPWLTEGSITLVSGWRGVGKTWFGLSLCDEISKGGAFGPWFVENPAPCLYVDGELHAKDLQDRLQDLENGKSRELPLYIFSAAHANSLGLGKLNLIRKQHREAVTASISEHKIKVLVLDCLAVLAPGMDENKKSEGDPINQWLLDLRFMGVATLLLHHVGKEGDQRGTSAREDNLDNSITLIKPNDYDVEHGARFIVKFKKNRIRASSVSLLADTEFSLREINGRIEWTWGGVKKKTQIEIIKMLDEGIAQVEIGKMLDVTKGYVSRIKAKAINDGYLSKQGKLTPSGFELVYPSGGEIQ